MKAEIKKLEKLNACNSGLAWAAQQTDAEAAWAACERGDWMLWLLGRTCACRS